MTLIDTDILIDAGRGIEDAVRCLDALEHESLLAISAIVQMELLVGCRNTQELLLTEHFLQRFQILPMNEHMSDMAVDLLLKYRLSHGLMIADALIASTAIVANAPFITKNQRHYRFLDPLHLLHYPMPSLA